MGFISTLMSGISAAGTVCQGIVSALGLKAPIRSNDGATTVYDSDLTVGGADFYAEKNSDDESDIQIFAHNANATPISVCLPNVKDVGGMELLVMPKKARNITDMLAPSVPPVTEMLIGPVCDTDTADLMATMKDTAVKITLNHLPLNNKPVMIGGMTVKADAETGKVTVESSDSAIGSMTYFSAVSQSDVTAEIQNVIYPDENAEALAIGVTRKYSIDFKELGFQNQDELACRMYFAIANGNRQRLQAHDAMCVSPPQCYLDYKMKQGKK